MEKRSMLARMLNAGLNGLGAALRWSMKLPACRKAVSPRRGRSQRALRDLGVPHHGFRRAGLALLRRIGERFRLPQQSPLSQSNTIQMSGFVDG
jgi:hypothetical protein